MSKKVFVIAILTAFCIPLSYGNRINQLNNESDSLRVIEKVYLHTDRNIYYSGDDIWFKAYLVDVSNSLPTNHSKNLHVELISPESKIIDCRIVGIKDGLGNGDFKLPLNLLSGRYLLRAYTNYMRNYGDQLFFCKEVDIVNASCKLDTLDTSKAVDNKFEVLFFPEGGSLVDSVTSIVAFKANSKNGLGRDISGKIYSSSGELVTTFSSTHLGMGKFSLKPISGLTYFAIAKTANGDSIKADIPKSFLTGITFNITRDHENKPLLTIRTNGKTLPLLLNHDLLLTITARKAVLQSIHFRIKSIVSSFILPVNDLPDGIAMLTLSSVDGLPLAERLIFIQQHDDARVKVQLSKVEYNTREQVTVNISIPRNSSAHQEAFLSLSAVEDFSLYNLTRFPTTISSWFLLESDIRGPVEEPSYYFNSQNINRLVDLDLLLLTQGWRDFSWKYDSSEYYPPEIGFNISGMVKKSLFKAPIMNSKVSIEVHSSKNSTMKSVVTDSSGRFCLKNVDFTGKAKLIVSTLGNKRRLQGRVFVDSLKFIPAKVHYSLTPQRVILKDKFTVLTQYAEQKDAIKKQYHLSDTILLDGINVIATKQNNDIQQNHIKSVRAIYGTPDEEVIMTPELGNDNVLEVIRHARGFVVRGDISTGISIMLHGPSTFGSSISSPNSMPLFLVDGVPTDFNRVYYSLPSEQIDRVDFLTLPSSTSKYGMQGGNGVVSIITKTSIKGSTEEPNVQVQSLKINGYSTPRIFYSPQHSNDKESVFKPDQRITLFWQPNIRLDNKKNYSLNYFNSDNSSTIRIVVEGITNDGIPLVGNAEYIIK